MIFVAAKLGVGQRGRLIMALARIDDIVRSLRELESSSAGRHALTSPRRGDYEWGDDPDGGDAATEPAGSEPR